MWTRNHLLVARTLALTWGLFLIAWAGVLMSTRSTRDSSDSKRTRTTVFFTPIDESAVQARSKSDGLFHELRDDQERQRRELKGAKTKKKKRSIDESPAKVHKLSMAPFPTTAPSLQPTPSSSLDNEKMSTSGRWRHDATPSSDYSASDWLHSTSGKGGSGEGSGTPSPTIITRSSDYSASDWHDSTSGKGGSGKGSGKKKKKKKAKSSKKSKSSRSERHPSLFVHTLPAPTLAPATTRAPSPKQDFPPFPLLIDVRPPSNSPVSTSIPTQTPIGTGQPVSFISIAPAVGNARPTPPLIVLSPVRVETPTTPSPTSLVQTTSPSVTSVVLLPPTVLPTMKAPSLVIDGSTNSTLSPTTFSPTTIGLSTFVPYLNATNATAPTVDTFEPTMAPIGSNSTMAPSSNTTSTPSSNATAPPSAPGNTSNATAPPSAPGNTSNATAPPSAPGSTIVPTTAPAIFTSLQPTTIAAQDDGVRRVAVPRTYLAFSAVGSERPPTPQETVFVLQLTTLYLEEMFADLYAYIDYSFARVEMELMTSLYEEGIPEEKFNIYLEVNTGIDFRVVDDTVQLPQASDLFNQMVDAILDTTYVRDYLWQMDRESPYFRTQEVAAAATVQVVPVPPGNDKLVAKSVSTISESVHQLEGRFVLPGSRVPVELFRPNDVVDVDDGEVNPTN